MSFELYIGNYPREFSREDVANLFRNFRGAKLVKFFQRDLKCFSFVTCVDIDQVLCIIEEKNNYVVGGRKLVVRATNNELQNYIDLLLEERKIQKISNDSLSASSSVKSEVSPIHEFQKISDDSSLISLRLMKNGRKRSDSRKVQEGQQFSSQLYNSKVDNHNSSYPEYGYKEDAIPVTETISKLNKSWESTDVSSSIKEGHQFYHLNHGRKDSHDSSYPEYGYKVDDIPVKESFSKLNNSSNASSSIKEGHRFRHLSHGRKDSHDSSYHEYGYKVDAIPVKETISKLNNSFGASSSSHRFNYSKVDNQNLSYPESSYRVDTIKAKETSSSINKSFGASLSKVKHESSATSKYYDTQQYYFSSSDSPSDQQNEHKMTVVPQKNNQRYFSVDDIKSSSIERGAEVPESVLFDQYGEDLNKLVCVSVTNFPLGTQMHVLRDLFIDYDPIDIYMVCNEPRKDRTLTEAIIWFSDRDVADDVIMNFDNTIFQRRLLLVNDLEDLTVMKELLVVNR